MQNLDYGQFYRQMTGRIRTSGAACFAVRAGGRAATGVMYAAYPLLLALSWGKGKSGFWPTLLIPAAAFLLLSLVRRAIDRPRPYEAWDISPIAPKSTRGKSMPSRHIFSSALIAAAWLRISAPAAAFLLALAAAAAVLRVLAGVHYPSDVAAGYALGLLAGLLAAAA